MRLEAFTGPPFDENAYLIADDSGEAAIVDPGDGAPALLARARALNLRVGHILLTHAHLDHISNVVLVKRAFDVPISLHPADQPLYDAIVEQGRYFGMHMRPQPPVDHPLADGMTLAIGNLSVRVRETPGHSPGGVVFEIGEPSGRVSLISGDTLFAGSIGRTDLPGGDYRTLIDSIQRVLLAFPDDVPVHPGHYGSTTIGAERRGNPFLTQ
jgi:glyoxylase-like metal-dependent hydrolase (beta-lactamase superfamily II)